jgi:hypothetical protein
MCYSDDKPLTADDWKQAARDIVLMCLIFVVVVLVAVVLDPSVGR